MSLIKSIIKHFNDNNNKKFSPGFIAASLGESMEIIAQILKEENLIFKSDEEKYWYLIDPLKASLLFPNESTIKMHFFDEYECCADPIPELKEIK